MASHARAPLGSISTCASRSPACRSQAVAAEVLLLQSHSLVQFCSRINRLRSSRICRLLLRGAQQAGGRQTRIESRQHSSSSSSLSSSSRQARIETRLPSSSSWCRGRNDVGFLLQARCIDFGKEEEVCEVEETPFLLQRSYVDGLESSAAVDVDVGRRRNEIGYAQGEEVLAQFLKGNFGGLAAAVVVLGLAYSYGFWNVDSAAAAATTERVSLDADMRALALGPGGPLMEEFWDNVRRYGFYFFTVVTGGKGRKWNALSITLATCPLNSINMSGPDGFVQDTIKISQRSHKCSQFWWCSGGNVSTRFYLKASLLLRCGAEIFQRFSIYKTVMSNMTVSATSKCCS